VLLPNRLGTPTPVTLAELFNFPLAGEAKGGVGLHFQPGLLDGFAAALADAILALLDGAQGGINILKLAFEKSDQGSVFFPRETCGQPARQGREPNAIN